MRLQFIRLHPQVPLPPAQGTPGSAGYDLVAAIEAPLFLPPNETALVPSGVAIYIQEPSVVGLLFPRSGLGHKRGIVLGNGTGVIDSDYQGEIRISLWNRSLEPQCIEPLERVAQLVFVPVIHPSWEEREAFSATSSRAEGGFGHSGTH